MERAESGYPQHQGNRLRPGDHPRQQCCRRYGRKGQVPPEGAVDAFVTGTNGVLDLVKNSADLGEVIETPFGKIPIAHFIMFPTLDIVIHKWDLAKGTGQNTDIDAGLAEATYGALQTGAELGRQFGIFAAEVEIPISASIHEKLLAISGRMP